MSSSVLVHMRQRNRTYERFITDRTDDNWRIYRKLLHHCVYNVRQAKQHFFNKSCNKTNKNFWNIAKSCTGLGKSKARSLHWPALTPSVANSTADWINNSFCNNVRDLVSKLMLDYNFLYRSENSDPLFEFAPCTVRQVVLAVDSIHTSANSCADRISINCLSSVLSLLLILMQTCLTAH